MHTGSYGQQNFQSGDYSPHLPSYQDYGLSDAKLYAICCPLLLCRAQKQKNVHNMYQ